MQDIEEIYKTYANTLYKYIFCLCNDKYLSEEIVQETFEVAIKNINKFKGDCKISTWLCQIAKYIWYNKLKKHKKITKNSFEEIENIVLEERSFEDKIIEK